MTNLLDQAIHKCRDQFGVEPEQINVNPSLFNALYRSVPNYYQVKMATALQYQNITIKQDNVTYFKEPCVTAILIRPKAH